MKSNKSLRKYNWLFYLTGSLIVLISIFTPAMQKEGYAYYLCLGTFRGNSLDIIWILIVSPFFFWLIPPILLIISLAKLMYFSVKMGLGNDVDSSSFILYASLLIAAISLFSLFLVLLTLSPSDYSESSIGFGIIGPIMGAICVFIGYFLGEK